MVLVVVEGAADWVWEPLSHPLICKSIAGGGDQGGHLLARIIYGVRSISIVTLPPSTSSIVNLYPYIIAMPTRGVVSAASISIRRACRSHSTAPV